MKQSIRKPTRLREYDYASNGAYFVTVCSKDKAKIFCRIVGRDDLGAPPCVMLTDIGKVVDKYICLISDAYNTVNVDKYVVMPNHIHLLLTIGKQRRAESSRPTDAEEKRVSKNYPTVSQIIAALKRFTNKETGIKLWQTSFHDHIIRDEHDYLVRWQYIDDNPAKWVIDEYFTP